MEPRKREPITNSTHTLTNGMWARIHDGGAFRMPWKGHQAKLFSLSQLPQGGSFRRPLRSEFPTLCASSIDAILPRGVQQAT